ncbi:hypothetical protein [Streptomyces sp. NPDC048560]|uniref:hypothetical protein n=1 Tax=Streptomyces sp. NPDC048560 TaxID=3155488 RepID=UPI0034132490
MIALVLALLSLSTVIPSLLSPGQLLVSRATFASPGSLGSKPTVERHDTIDTL